MISPVDLPLVRMRELAHDEEFLAVMRGFHERLETDIAAHRPVCRRRGDCCRFGNFGHQLYVTPAELAFFLGTVEAETVVPPGARACPYQIDGLCGVRLSRPMGCRVFFCESAGQGWQERLTESALAELRGLHARFALPYAYVEWLGALRQIMPPAPDPP